MKTEFICIVGKSGSGKNYLLNGLIQLGCRYESKVTTRKMRDDEKNGVEYNFIDNQQFQLLVEENKLKVSQKFEINGEIWNYGMEYKCFGKNKVNILTPFELNQLSDDDRKGCFVIYLDIEESVRRERISKRLDNNDSIDRRISSDEEDFKGFDGYDLKLTDPDFEVDLVYQFAY